MRIVRSSGLVVAACLAAATAGAETIYISTTSRLQSFDSGAPGALLADLAVSGLAGGETLEGIDFRPATGELYGLGSTGQLYSIDPDTAVATAVGSAVALAGTRFGMDFNPTVDRIRIVSNSGSNIRRHPVTGALAATDTGLAYAIGDINEGDLPGVAGAAYTNSINGATTTTLYDLELTNDVLATQNPPNSGTLNTVGTLDFANADGFVGFDISVRSGIGWAAFDSGAGTQLYEVDLGNGRATPRGAIAGSPQVTGLTVALTQGPCLPSTTSLCLLNDRFQVNATWATPSGANGSAQVVRLSNESGYMTFFTPGILEATIKVLDGCSNNGHYWVFASGLTNLEVAITVRDLVTGESFPIANPQGQLFNTVASIEALNCN